MNRCPYQVLGVSRNSSSETIKDVANKKAKEYHPDKNVGNELEALEREKEIIIARDVLRNVNLRHYFDEYGKFPTQAQIDAAWSKVKAYENDEEAQSRNFVSAIHVERMSEMEAYHQSSIPLEDQIMQLSSDAKSAKQAVDLAAEAVADLSNHVTGMESLTAQVTDLVKSSSSADGIKEYVKLVRRCQSVAADGKLKLSNTVTKTYNAQVNPKEVEEKCQKLQDHATEYGSRKDRELFRNSINLNKESSRIFRAATAGWNRTVEKAEKLLDRFPGLLDRLLDSIDLVDEKLRMERQQQQTQCDDTTSSDSVVGYLKKQLEQSQRKISEYGSNQAELQRRLKRSDDKLGKSWRELYEAQQKLHALGNEKKALETDRKALEDAKTVLENAKQAFENEKVKVRSTSKIMMEKFQALEENSAAKEQQASSEAALLRQQIVRLQQQVSALKNDQHMLLGNDRMALEAERKTYESYRNAYQTEKTAMCSSYKALEEKFQLLQQSFDIKTIDLKNLQAHVSAQQTHIQNQNATCQEARTTILEVVADNESYINENADLSKELEKLKNENEVLENQLKELMTKLESEKMDREEVEKELEVVSSWKSQTEPKLVLLQQQLETTQTEMKAAIIAKEDAQNKLSVVVSLKDETEMMDASAQCELINVSKINSKTDPTSMLAVNKRPSLDKEPSPATSNGKRLKLVKNNEGDDGPNHDHDAGQEEDLISQKDLEMADNDHGVNLWNEEDAGEDLDGNLGENDDHESEKTGNSDQEFVCKECGASFTHLNNLRRHSFAHTSVFRHICPRCGVGFNRADSYNKHMKRKFPCDEK